MLERVLASGLDDVLKHLLVNVIETFFALSDEDAEEYRRLVSRKEYGAVQEVELTWADRLMEKGREEGREKGREEGLVEGMRRMLLSQLTAKFGDLPDEVRERVLSLSGGALESVLDRVLTAARLEELWPSD